ncbi:MAG6450 family protein [Mycoplasmopsis agalactiae]|uniref:MAG6450 family protein n=1 Tax=Mycoplasmopsis agalactiae TaxID=2110 RepID=UPI001F44FCDE|nr:hypothetical protein [Mycoplasmopsis agalactiae]MCE6115499.1 hypothetical protein [Mycoplasmopsis agalactiae]
MSKKLTNKTLNGSKSSLVSGWKSIYFRFAIVHKLDNGFDFKSLNAAELGKFHNFINEIFKRKMTISDVEKNYMRKHAKPLANRRMEAQDIEVNEIHLGKDNNSFRIFGYLNKDNYFVLTKIDPKHRYHK